ncbi:hypothetical protein LUZ60_011882 [Juncus effusus]|nr:hypothetical protein LUZ60_011882 [Juncus effusus]
MKIVTYNINGLRPRVAQHGSLLRLLNSLHADVICFQETKVTRQDLSADITMAEGYEAFLSCSRISSKGRGGYSGVATFCRVTSAFSSSEVALPLSAEEGFTGLLEGPKIGNKDSSEEFCVEVPLKVDNFEEDISKEELIKLDSEGRCVITDHGHFVLFNIYGPRAEQDDKDRVRFKLLFYQILHKRWKYLLDKGKRVFIVGDLNIAPFSIDRCDADPSFEKNMFREWLRSLLRDSGGPFIDAFRSKHPHREGAYTCFSQRTGAEEFNYGSRIDHILISGSCFHKNNNLQGPHCIFDCHVERCDILTQFKRGNSNSDALSKWNGGRSNKLEGSDHIPVYIKLINIPDLPIHNTPLLAMRYIPEVRGFQQTIVSFLSKGQSFTQVQEESSKSTFSEKSQAFSGITSSSQEIEEKTLNSPDFSLTKRKITNSNSNISSIKKAKNSKSSQLTIKSFFKQTNIQTEKLREEELESCSDQNVNLEGFEDRDVILSKERGDSAILEWERIKERMKMSLPLCKGHREPCVARSVKKGANIGRLFYVCARAQGPASNPEANCNHFQWASVKSKDRQR